MTVDHDTLTDPELHEPKGLAVAGADTVLIADGAGSGVWNSHATFTDPDIHEPKDISTANNGEVYMADGAGGGSWGSLTVAAQFIVITLFIDDIKNVEDFFIASPVAGTITRIDASLQDSGVSSDTILSFSIGGLSITNGDITVTTGGAAGDVFSSLPTGNNTVGIGAAIKCDSDGATNTSNPMIVTIVIQT